MEDISKMKSMEKWGVSVEEALDYALKEMKLTEDQVKVTVIEEPSRGFFGIGSKLAKIRVDAIDDGGSANEADEAPAVEKKKEWGPVDKQEVSEEDLGDRDREERKPRHRDRKGGRDRNRDRGRNRDRKVEVTEYTAAENIALDGIDKDSLTEVEEHEALTFLRGITDRMGLTLDFKVCTGEDLVYIEMSGDDARTIIGKRGQTLDAVQYLTSLVVNKNRDNYIKVVMDAENYRSKRQKTLEQLANRLAAKAVRTGKFVRLEPMNPYERKVIHSTLQQHPDVETRSEGEEPYRRVIIEKK